MSQENPLKIGSRKSQLALVQTEQVKKLLKDIYHNHEFDIVEMSTKGDEVLDRALYKIGDKSLFTKELENALLNGQVDMVVHSLKDLPSTLPDGLVIGAILERVDPSDVIVMKSTSEHKTWEALVQTSEKPVIGTSSVRRTAQLRGSYPSLTFQDIRGNLNTRMKKLDDPNGPFDAIILAAAGILRLDWGSRMHRALRTDECLHAIGQGALAVECRADDQTILDLLKPLNHRPTVLSAMAERALMRFLDGGCSAPIAAHAEVENESLAIDAGVWSLCGKTCVRDKLVSPLKESLPEAEGLSQLSAITIPKDEDKSPYLLAHRAGIQLGQTLVGKGARSVLESARAQVHGQK